MRRDGSEKQTSRRQPCRSTEKLDAWDTLTARPPAQTSAARLWTSGSRNADSKAAAAVTLRVKQRDSCALASPSQALRRQAQ